MNTDLVALVGIVIFMGAILLMMAVSNYSYDYYMREMREEEERLYYENL